MTTRTRLALCAALFATFAAGPAFARPLGIEVWTDRGDEAVYQPGEPMTVKFRTSDDAHVLVYEIGVNGDLRLLWPLRRGAGIVDGRETYRVPSEDSGLQLEVENQVGQAYIVAIASREPFADMPWYLRPYDPNAEELGFVGNDNEEEEGVTPEGRIVGDPFVAMERVRRRVLSRPTDGDQFASSYASYYVHHQVKYPRYICNDCHRPNRWAWWDGYDPYYSRCSVFEFRVNWRWAWGPSYWFGNVPYYCYVPRYDCPPAYSHYYAERRWWGGWDGWNTWNGLWGSHLRRYKSPPPAGYTPPPSSPSSKPIAYGPGRPLPPGFLTPRTRASDRLPIGRNRRDTGTGERDSQGSRGQGWQGITGDSPKRERVGRMPGRPTSPSDEGEREPARRDDYRQPPPRPMPANEPPRGESEPEPRRRDDTPRPKPQYEPPRPDDRREPPSPPREEAPRKDPPRLDPPKPQPPADSPKPPPQRGASRRGKGDGQG